MDTNEKPPHPGPLLHPMEEREGRRALAGGFVFIGVHSWFFL
jgi:hypothetical protein